MCENDKKISPLVEAINGLGIITLWSCEGHDSPTLIQSPIPKIITTTTSNISKESYNKLLIAMSSFNNEIVVQDFFWCLRPTEQRTGIALIIAPLDRRVPLDVHQENIERFVQSCKKINP